MKSGLLFSFSLLLAIETQSAGPLGYAPVPNDTYWSEMWHLENLDTNAVRRGIDANARAAWSMTRGAGVTIAVVDDGVELHHPDLAARAAAGLHWNFESDTPNGGHTIDAFQHGTAVAGMAAAQGGNQRGMIGIAPEARFASWVIFRTNGSLSAPFVSPEQRAKMFQFQNQSVQVQNHSWVTPGGNLVPVSMEEHLAISNAVTLGRGSKGVVIVRAAGNNRVSPQPRNVNEDAYTSDPRVITVAAVRYDGRVASYSTPGAAILVAAPSGDPGFPSPFSTDRLGSKGFNQISFTNDLAEYVFAGLWFGGTSSAAPLISGIAALILSANPDLTYRDVQQILIHAAYQPDPADPGIVENGAGYRVSHNTGFGLVNAGTAVDLARTWKTRPPLVVARASASLTAPALIPDEGLALLVETSPTELLSITPLPSLGAFPDTSTLRVPLVFVGTAAAPIAEDLRGKGALIRRGDAPFAQKILNAQNAGALFAVVYNNQGDTQLEVMGSTDFIAIPSIFISQRDGDALAGLATNQILQAQIAYQPARISIPFEETLIAEHVSVTLDWEHELRGDLRVTLLSPSGTRSVLHRLGDSGAPVSGSWTFTSTQHFYESTRGAWTIEIGDQVAGGTGSVLQASIEIRGVAIADSDNDGLDDTWEQQYFTDLARGPKDDPDHDGYSNAREQILGANPAANENRLELALAQWSNSIVRMNWPSKEGAQYEVLGFTNLTQPPAVLATVNGGFPRTAWFGKSDTAYRFFQVREKP